MKRFLSFMSRFLIAFALLSCVGPSKSVEANRDVTLEWEYPGSNPDGFKLYRGYGGGKWPVLVADVAGDLREWTDQDVPHGDLHWIVTSYTGGKESHASNEAVYAYYYATTKYDYDASGRLLYKGEHATYNASPDDANWVVSKYYYDASGMVSEIRVRTTSWTNRATGW
jgi:hypothetical protein